MSLHKSKFILILPFIFLILLDEFDKLKLASQTSRMEEIFPVNLVDFQKFAQIFYYLLFHLLER